MSLIAAFAAVGLPAAASSRAREAPRCTAAPPSRRPAPQAPPAAPSHRTSQYDQLAAMTTIVEDTGEINYIEKHRPFAATTNPSLVAKAAELPEYSDVVEEAVEYGKKHGGDAESVLRTTRNRLFVSFGKRILDYVPGDVSTEVDARLSFDVQGQIDTAQDLIKMYEEIGVSRERVLIKLATTWEGVEACRALESQGIKTNMTLLFGMAQAVAAAEAGAYLISPFVGRILDWYKKKEGVEGYPPAEDPGVLSVRNIYNYYKCMGHDTIVMGASFRNKDEILQLAGCDRLTIAPKFITDMKESYDAVPQLLSKPAAEECSVEKISLDEKGFRWEMNQNAMATEKLAEGIRGFAVDLERLDDTLRRLVL